MAVRIEKTFQVKEPVDEVWTLLSDPRQVVSCVPGAQLTEAVDERTFKGAISVKVGPTVTDYKGQVHIDRLDAQTHEIELAGKGQDVRGRGSASMKMTGKVRALPGGTTEVTAVSEVNIVGLLAQLGARVISDVADLTFAEFTKRFQEQLTRVSAAENPATPENPIGEAGEPPKPVNAVGLLFAALGAAIGRFFRRLFGGRPPH